LEGNRRYNNLRRKECATLDGVSEVEWENWLNSLDYPKKLGKSVQRDLSEYDKSLGHAAGTIMFLMNLLMGHSEEFLNAYYSIDTFKSIRARVLGLAIKFAVEEMQRSGRPSTLSDNSVVNEFTEMYVGGYETKEDIISSQVQGDDIEVMTRHGFKPATDSGQRSADLFNLNEKREIFSADVRYNCSRFMILVRGRWTVVYDPWKLMAKFGRGLTTGHYKVLSERYISYKALTRHYFDMEVRYKVAQAAYQMYGMKIADTMVAFCSCVNMLSSEERFIANWAVKTVYR